MSLLRFNVWQEIKALPPLAPGAFGSPHLASPSNLAELDISLIIPARKCGDSLITTVEEAHRFLSRKSKVSFEIILVPNPAPGDLNDRSIEIAERLAVQYPEVKVHSHFSPPGKGAAIRTGAIHARGRWFFFTDADLPYDLEFFDRALEKLKSGYDLVTGNRRLPESHFNIPVELLRLAYRRHRLGLAYNRLVRWFLPIYTTDTQAGIKAFSRKLAISAFQRQACPGFLFDLEIFLTAHGFRFRQIDLPVTLDLNTEKSTVRILRECVMVANWLTRITWRNFRKVYQYQGDSLEVSSVDGRVDHKGETAQLSSILSRYSRAKFSTRLFLRARWKLTPYRIMASKLPQKGKILDLGCGHGLFALATALGSPSREVHGIDHDAERVTLGIQATQGIPNIQIKSGTLTHPPGAPQSYSAVAMIDVMHYFDPKTQEDLLQQAFEMLEPGGTLLFREVNPHAGITSIWNRLYEKIATKIGFTRAEKSTLYFRTPQDWEGIVKKNGFRVTSERCSSFLFADILYICERPNTQN